VVFLPCSFLKGERVEEGKKIVKDDINFLEYPNWVIDRKNKANTWTTERANGKYEIISPLGLPKHFDKIVLYYLLYKLHREKNLDAYLLTTTRYEIAKNVFPGVKDFGKNKFARIMLALKKWNALSINFDGLFYSNDERSVRYFHFVDEVVLHPKSGELTVKFNESYIKQLKETTFYKLIDFEQYKKLHKTSSARLYEILVKNFKERNEWAINLQGLAEKLTFERRENAKHYYPSDVLRYLKPAINEINKKTDLCVQFSYNQNDVCVFKKVKKPKESFVPAFKEESKIKDKKKELVKKQHDESLARFNSLPAEEQRRILGEIAREPFLKYLPDQESRIMAYMTTRDQAQN
jgi:hypothetical protein